MIATMVQAKDYTKKHEVRIFIDQMVRKYHFNRSYLNRLFSHIKFQKRALAIYVPSLRPRGKVDRVHRKEGSWDRYERIFLKDTKVDKGVAYMHRHRDSLLRAYRKYGVQPEYITAIIGIESHYGKNTGKYPVLDTLTTLAFEQHRRSV